MTTALIILGLLLLAIILLYQSGKKDAYKEPPNGTVIRHDLSFEKMKYNLAHYSTPEDDGTIFMENDIDEFSPENLAFDETLTHLKTQKDIDLDYQDYEGK